VFKFYDYVAIAVFTQLFYFGVMGLIYGGFVGGVVLFITWELWKMYETWRVSE
jgi:hypothetical protein|tara:strand:+ start:220 stop:378 length:159 start_codon:yes stop_codon:yes gene_type:complete